MRHHNNTKPTTGGEQHAGQDSSQHVDEFLVKSSQEVKLKHIRKQHMCTRVMMQVRLCPQWALYMELSTGSKFRLRFDLEAQVIDPTPVGGQYVLFETATDSSTGILSRKLTVLKAT